MTKADNALINANFRTFALRVVEFSRCKVLHFADGSFLVLHDNGRAEANTINV